MTAERFERTTVSRSRTNVCTGSVVGALKASIKWVQHDKNYRGPRATNLPDAVFLNPPRTVAKRPDAWLSWVTLLSLSLFSLLTVAHGTGMIRWQVVAKMVAVLTDLVELTSEYSCVVGKAPAGGQQRANKGDRHEQTRS